jgi:acetyltransferase-like isoleucine patch superfamily enzyme
MKGRVVIHEYVIVGAMSMVTKSLPEWKICRGIPARVLKERSKKLKELEQQFLDLNNNY